MIKPTVEKLLSKRITYVILSVLIACCLWLYVVSVENPEVETDIRNIPVQFVGEDSILEDRGLMLSAGKDSAISLRVRATRSVISKLDKNNVTITVDISGITEPGDYTRGYNIVWPNGVSENDLTIVSRSSYGVSVSIARQSSKTVPVQGVLTGDVADGFIRQEFVFDPSEVVIRGPEELISQVEYARVTLNRENVNKTIEVTSEYELIDADGNVIDSEDIVRETEEIDVRLPVIQQKKIWLDVELKDGGGATSSDAVVSIDPPYITVAGDPEILETYNSITVASIDLYSVISSVTEEYPIVLINGVQNISGDMEAKVIVTLTGLETKNFAVNNIELTNIPEGYYAEAETRVVNVSIRGKAEAVDELLPGNITVVANLSGIGEGTAYVPAKVIINGKVDAGAVGDYAVYVTVSDTPLNDG